MILKDDVIAYQKVKMDTTVVFQYENDCQLYSQSWKINGLEINSIKDLERILAKVDMIPKTELSLKESFLLVSAEYAGLYTGRIFDSDKLMTYYHLNNID